MFKHFTSILVPLIFLTNITVSAQVDASDYLKAAINATEQKQYTRAIALCDAAINKSNTYSAAYFHRGYNKLLIKDYEGAIVDFTVCLDLSPDNLWAYLYRGHANQKAGNSWSATRDFNSARKIDSIETLAFMTANMFRSSLGK
jgi:tetratricopeptide (TPR) repeat protein